MEDIGGGEGGGGGAISMRNKTERKKTVERKQIKTHKLLKRTPCSVRQCKSCASFGENTKQQTDKCYSNGSIPQTCQRRHTS